MQLTILWDAVKSNMTRNMNYFWYGATSKENYFMMFGEKHDGAESLNDYKQPNRYQSDSCSSNVSCGMQYLPDKAQPCLLIDK